MCCRKSGVLGWGHVTMRTAFVIGDDVLRCAEARAAAIATGLHVELSGPATIEAAFPDDAVILAEVGDDLADTLSLFAACGSGLAWIVSLTPDCLDAAAPLIGLPGVQILCDPSAADRLAALAVAVRRADALAEADVAREVLRLQQIADEVARIATALADQPALVRFSGASSAPDGQPLVGVDDIRSILRLRRKRAMLFGDGVFADPAWDMLLDLTAARIDGIQVPVSSLCLAAAVPATTALRWMRTLFELGMIERQSDPDDRRRVHIALTDGAYAAMIDLLGEAKRVGLAML